MTKVELLHEITIDIFVDTRDYFERASDCFIITHNVRLLTVLLVEDRGNEPVELMP